MKFAKLNNSTTDAAYTFLILQTTKELAEKYYETKRNFK